MQQDAGVCHINLTAQLFTAYYIEQASLFVKQASTFRHFYIFLKMGQPLPLFQLFLSFCTNLVAGMIRTRIVGVEGKDPAR